MYNTDLKRLTVLILPTMLRKKVIYTLLRSSIKPIQRVQGYLNTYREDCSRRMTHTSQVCYLKDILKYTFGGTFDIEDTIVLGDWFITYDEDEEPNYVPIFMNEDNENFSSTDYTIIYNENNIDEREESFIVYYPTTCGIDEGNDSYLRMKAIVDMYRLASKKAIYKPLIIV